MTDQERRAMQNCLFMVHDPTEDEEVNRILRIRRRDAHVRNVIEVLKIAAYILIALAAIIFS